MRDQTRRSFLVLAGAGAAAVGVGAAAGRATARTAQPAAARPSGSTHGTTAEAALVAHVADVHGDTVSLLVGEREVVVHDADLVARLARAAV